MAGGEFFNHFNSVRLRVIGSGNLKMQLIGLDDVDSTTLIPIAMTSTDKKFQNRLSNFLNQKARFKFTVTAIDEYFTIKQINIYTKPVYTGYPQ